MIRVTKYKTADGLEFMYRMAAEEHEKEMETCLKEVHQKCEFLDDSHDDIEIINDNVDGLFRDINEAVKTAVYIRVKEKLSFDAFFFMNDKWSSVRLVCEKGLYKRTRDGYVVVTE